MHNRIVQCVIVVCIILVLLFAASWFHLLRAVSAPQSVSVRSRNNGKKFKSGHEDDSLASASSSAAAGVSKEDILKALGGDNNRRRPAAAVAVPAVPALSSKHSPKGEDSSEHLDQQEPEQLVISSALEKPLEKLQQNQHQLKGIDFARAESVQKKIMSSADPDVELFVMWKDALPHTDRILIHMRSNFLIVAIEYFDWTSSASSSSSASTHNINNNKKELRHNFETNLWRLYGGKGGWQRHNMAKKVKQCGFGPFIAIVVVDPNPDYRDEQTAHGIDHVNHNMNSAKKMYREWSGGGFRVHGTFGPREAEHDIPLLFHRARGDFAQLAKTQTSYIWKSREHMIVDWFVDHLLAFSRRQQHEHKRKHGGQEGKKNQNDGSGSGDSGGDVLPSIQFAAPLALLREASGSRVKQLDRTCDASSRDDSIAAVPLLPRDQMIVNEFITTRETLGAHGWLSCRDFILALRSYDAVILEDGKSGDDAFTTAFEKSPHCMSCEQWPKNFGIWVSDETTRWAVASLLSGGTPLLKNSKQHEMDHGDDVSSKNKKKENEKWKEPDEFDVPFLLDHGRKKVTKRILVAVKG